MTPAEIAKARAWLATWEDTANPECGCPLDEPHDVDCPTAEFFYRRDVAKVALRDFFLDHAAELLDATEKLAATETWAKRQFDLRSTAERERDEARAIVALLADALHTWGQEEDGVPEDGPVAEAYDTALSMLAVWRKS